MANLSFDANTVEPSMDFDPIPEGKYSAVITASEMKPTKSGNGSYLELTFELLDGQYRGRRLWSRLNLDNPNQMAVKIAKSELSALCRAVGVMQPQDSVELHNIPLTITVKCKRREDKDLIANEISGYSSRQSSSAPATSAAPAQAPQGSVTPPWRR